MDVSDLELDGVKLITPRAHRDQRGVFLETWRADAYRNALGAAAIFVQHNQSLSRAGVLRGLHFQLRHGQGKLVRVTQGRIWDVVVDVREQSATFGRWLGVTLAGIGETDASGPHRQLWIPPGFAHGFTVLSHSAIVDYFCTDYYRPDDEYCLRWDDADLGIDWPVRQPVVSQRDARGMSLRQLGEAGLLPACRPQGCS